MLVSYAQNAEDIVLLRVFNSIPKGFYIDIGACFPEEGSVTKLFYDRGWSGINVEPHPTPFAMLIEQRVRDINLNIAISNDQGPLTLYEYPSIGETSALHRENATCFEATAWTLKSLCETYVNETIDFLKIDVEGHELNVLLSGDWTSFRPKVIICEVTLSWSNQKRPDSKAIDDFLTQQGYLLAYFDGINHYYVANEHSALVDQLALQPNVIDNFISNRENTHRQQVEHLSIANNQLQNHTKSLEVNLNDLKIKSECERIVLQQENHRFESNSQHLENINQKLQLKIYKTKTQNTTYKLKINDLIAAEILTKQKIEELTLRITELTNAKQELEKNQFKLQLEHKFKDNLMEQYSAEIQRLMTKEHDHHERVVSLELLKLIHDQEVAKSNNIIENLKILNEKLLAEKLAVAQELTNCQREVARLHEVINENNLWGKQVQTLIEKLSERLQAAQIPWYKKYFLVEPIYRLIRKTAKMIILLIIFSLKITAKLLRKLTPKTAEFLINIKWIKKLYTLLTSTIKKSRFSENNSSPPSPPTSLHVNWGASHTPASTTREGLVHEVQKWSLGKRVDV